MSDQPILSERLELPDGAQCVLNIHLPRGAARWVALLLPAMGTPVAFYHPFARALAAAGHVVVCADLRGQGQSSERAALGHRFGYRELLTLDLPALQGWIRQRYPQLPLAVVGHSLGAQMLCLGLESGLLRAEAFVSIAAGTAWRRNWRGLGGVAYSALIAVIGLANRWLPWYPGSLLGFGGDQPREFMRDWLENARRGEYLSALQPALSGYRGARPPTLALSIEGDAIAPPAAESDLLSRLSTWRITRHSLRGQGSRWRRHFAWARRPQAVVAAIEHWLVQQAPSLQRPSVEQPVNAQGKLPALDRDVGEAAWTPLRMAG